MNAKHMMMGLLVGGVLMAGTGRGFAEESATDTYKADLAHGTLGFRVSHLVISKVNGHFKDYTATLQMDGDNLVSAVTTIQAASIDTGIADRDAHLRNADFLEVDVHPEITFVSKGVRGSKLIGDLTIRGVTKTIVLDYTIKGPVQDPWGNTKIGFEAKGQIDRREFGLTWSKALETGGLLVGNEVEFLIDIQFAKQ